MKTDTHKNVETLRQIFSADKLNTSVLDHVLDTDTLLGIAKDGNGLVNENNGIRAHTDVPSYPDPNGKTINSYVCEITIAPTPNESGLGMSWFENSLEDINKDLLSLGLQEIEDIGETCTVHKHGIDIKIIVKYITGEYDKRYESYSIPEIKSKFDEKLKEAIKKSNAKTNSYRRNNMKKTIKSGRFIKSGTSNFVSNDGNFPLCVYISEQYVYDEETDTQTEERDYDAEQWDYEDAVHEAENLADEMGITLYKAGYRRGLDGGDDYSSPYNVGITSGYYEGIQIQIEDNGSFDPEYMAQDDYDYTHDDSFYDLPQEEQDRLTSETEEKLVKEQEDKINAYLEKLRSYGWIWLGVSARFSNGETMYTKIDNSRKPIQSANYDGIKKQMQYTLDVLKEDAEDSDEEYAERMGYDGTDAGAVRYAINRFKNEYGIRNRYNVVNQSELADWLAGLPLSFDYANYNILQKGVEWGYLPPIQEGTDLTRKEANWLDNWWNGLANNILKLARKYNVGITSSRKPVTSGLTFRQAVQDFKAAGQWNDYYEMQQDWEAYKDGLERDGVISEKTRSTWGNPCTPEGFKRWNK